MIHYTRGARAAEEAVVRRLREEYEDLMKQGRIEAARHTLAAHDRALLRLRASSGG